MENSPNVNIFLRVRPPQIWEVSSPMKTFIDFNKSTEKMFIIENNPYCFDRIFYDNSSNMQIFQHIESNINHLLNGYNSCILAYGQSGSGKTFTMGLNEKNIGMISLCLDSIFTKLEDKQNIYYEEYSVQVSYIEIYNEKVYDLFSERGSESIHTKGTKYSGSSKISIRNSYEAKELLLKGNKIRHTRSTLLNANSSRSHAMFTIILHAKSENHEKASALHLVDLAGSEGVRRTNHSGIAQQEGVYINQGLLTVGRVIQTLSNGKNVVPYRESILTTVLLDCLNLESYLTLIACISPARKDRSETLSTIRFAQSCKNLENKLLPEMNAYLKEQQRTKVQTPLKSHMLSNIRNDKTKSPGPGKFRSNLGQKTGLSTIKKPSIIKGFNSFITPSTKKVTMAQSRYTDLSDVNRTRFLYPPKESIDNNTFNIMNMSCSTEVDGPTTSMAQFTVNTNLSSLQASIPAMPSFSPLMRCIEKTIDEKMSAFINSFRNQTAIEADSAVIHQQMKDAVKEGLNDVRKSLNIEKTFMNGTTSFELTSYPACSTVIREPQNQNMDAVADKRSNRRLMTVDLTEESPLKSKSLENPTMCIKSPKVNETVIQARRSTRIQMRKLAVNSKVEHNKIPKIKTLQAKKDFLEIYSTADTSKLITKKDHGAAILKMLNTGTIKDIQLLPTIGLKTAYQIVTYRAIKGKFKTLNDLKNGLEFKNKAWERFLEKNFLK